jgi:hypothetical protein
VVGWGQPHSGAYRTRGDGCEETAEAERCKPGAPLWKWTEGLVVCALKNRAGSEEGQVVGWGQPQSGAYRTRGDGCEETAKAERCEPSAPLCTWTNSEEVSSLSCLRGPREARVKARGGRGFGDMKR